MHNKILRLPAVKELTGMAGSTIYALMAEGAFPRPIRLGKRAVGWRQLDVIEWLDARDRA